ncbi:unnamed protein product [[Candida] boidinii]|uniref:Unnamed protein product n=1 Tax=Candida boidinii TaxID=5477 RepID=A0A9W6SZC0_CANBO|nr:hypothetical protein B5S30_g3078 [[Candida] boidinii]GME69302.1 unnamed protein product [[Candida] boidinii]
MSNKLLEERLKAHSNAFSGLLSLIPAKYYYDEDTENQWQKKKQSKEELKSNKRKKLDPTLTNDTTAKEILESRSKTAQPVRLPGARINNTNNEDDDEDKEGEDEDNDSTPYGSEEIESGNDSDESDGSDDSDDDEVDADEADDENFIKSDEDEITLEVDEDKKSITKEEQLKLKEEENKIKQQRLQNNKNGHSKDKQVLTDEQKRERQENLRKLREKLATKIQSMKEKRKAPGTNVPGAARSRAEILEERKKREEIRKQQPKRKREDDEDNDDDDEESDSDIESEDEKESLGQNVMFGNIEFNDGERVNSDLSGVRKTGKRKGPSNNDIKAHLKKLEKEKEKLKGFSKEEQDAFEEKKKWTRALSNVQGIKVKDNEVLLKKALKRKESKKFKSEREWKDRKQMVADTIKAKQDRREENLRIRRENKGKPRSQQQNQIRAPFKGKKNKRDNKRAGFEGRIKSSAGNNKTGGNPSGKAGGRSGGRPTKR